MEAARTKSAARRVVCRPARHDLSRCYVGVCRAEIRRWVAISLATAVALDLAL